MTDAALIGRKVLILEDEYYIAADLKRMLLQVGVEPVGPTADVSGAFSLIQDRAIDAAILDVNLDGARSYPVADLLSGRDIPYLFLTGYDAWSLPDDYCDVPRIAKPFAARALLDLLATLFAPGARP